MRRIILPDKTTCHSITTKIGCSAHTLLDWVKRAEIDAGKRVGLPTETAVKRLAALVAAMAQKPLVMADGAGRAIAFRLASGQAHELPHAVPLLDRTPGVLKWVVADRGYTSHAFRQYIWNMGARPAIPPLRHEAPVACPDWIYTNRNRVERLWTRLKEWRAAATRYEKTAASFLGILSLAAAFDWIRR